MRDIYNHIHLLDPTIGQATIYRNVNKLVENGILKRLALDNDVDHYDIELSQHYHFVCTNCHKIVDICSEELNTSIDHIMKENDLDIQAVQVVLYGKCNHCKK